MLVYQRTICFCNIEHDSSHHWIWCSLGFVPQSKSTFSVCTSLWAKVIAHDCWVYHGIHPPLSLFSAPMFFFSRLQRACGCHSSHDIGIPWHPPFSDTFKSYIIYHISWAIYIYIHILYIYIYILYYSIFYYIYFIIYILLYIFYYIYFIIYILLYIFYYIYIIIYISLCIFYYIYIIYIPLDTMNKYQVDPIKYH